MVGAERFCGLRIELGWKKARGRVPYCWDRGAPFYQPFVAYSYFLACPVLALCGSVNSIVAFFLFVQFDHYARLRIG